MGAGIHWALPSMSDAIVAALWAMWPVLLGLAVFTVVLLWIADRRRR